MKLINFSMIDNDKFKNGFDISFMANNHKKDNIEFIEDGVLKWNVIFGKNGSGKSSIYRAILSYFNIFSKINMTKTKHEEDSLEPSSNMFSNWIFESEEHNKIDKDILKLKKMFKKQYSDNPRYTITYKYKDKNYVHSVQAKLDISNQPVFKHKIFLEDSFKNIIRTKNFAYDLRLESLESLSKSSLFSSNKYNDFIATMKSFIDITAKAAVLPTATWDNEIVEWINNLMTSGDEDAVIVLQNIAKWTDNNFIRFKNFVRTGMVPMATIKIGNTSKDIPIKELSTGTRRAIYTMMKIQVVINSPVGGLFIKDEFETFLHRDIVTYLLKSPLEHSNFQGFATSHSPYIFDYEIRYDSIYYLRNEENVITVEEFKDKNGLPRSDRKISSLYYNNPFTNPED